MSKNQIDRLKKDNKELGHYIAKLHKKGKTDLAYKMSKKQDFLNQTIADTLQMTQQEGDPYLFTPPHKGGVVWTVRTNIMPLYDFRNIDTDEITEAVVSIANYDQYLIDNPHLVRTFTKAPMLVSGSKSALSMAGSGHRELLQRIKDGSGEGNTIKT